MPKMIIQQEGIDVTKRFFLALETLRSMRKIRGLQTFTRLYNLNKWNMVTLRDEPDGHILKTECLVFLVRDFGISAEWLLIGTGDMFAKSSDS